MVLLLYPLLLFKNHNSRLDIYSFKVTFHYTFISWISVFLWIILNINHEKIWSDKMCTYLRQLMHSTYSRLIIIHVNVFKWTFFNSQCIRFRLRIMLMKLLGNFVERKKNCSWLISSNKYFQFFLFIHIHIYNFKNHIQNKNKMYKKWYTKNNLLI